MAKKRSETQRWNFTERRLASMPAPPRRMLVYDSHTRKLGVKLEPTGAKTFFWTAFVPHPGGKAGPAMWRTIGMWPEISLEAARDKADELNGMLANWKKEGCPPPSPFRTDKTSARVPTFGELLGAYIASHVQPNALTPARAERYVRYTVNKHLAAWRDRPLNEITTDDVLRAKQSCGRKHYAANGVVELVRRLFNWSVGEHDGKLNFWNVANPAANVSFHEIRDRKRKRFLQPDELVRFNEQLEKEEHRDLRDVLVLLLATGARKGNVYEMRWADVSFALKKWHVPMSKSGEGYDVNLTPAALQVLERRRREIPDPFVFPANSRAGHIRDVKKRWAAFRDRCGFPDVRLHDLRRTRGSYLAIGGVSLQQIGAALGHKSLGSTQIYARLHDEAVTKALETGDAMMKQMMAQARKRIKAAKPKQLPGARHE